MVSLGQYKMYRKANKELNSKIIHKCVNRQTYLKAVNLLGINFDDNKVFFEFEAEISYVMDFAINDIKSREKTAVETYQKIIGGKNKVEKQILQSLVLSYTSLFRVVKTNGKKQTIILYDVLNNSEIELIDYHLSKTLYKNRLLFCRVLRFDDFNMTSGIGFIYPIGLEKYLLMEYGRIKKMKKQTDNIVRFVSFFKLNRTDGDNIVYVNPP